MNKIERIKLGRGSAKAMGLAGMHCVRRCMCVFMLKSCDSVGFDDKCVLKLGQTID
jgi:hypothetical protein